MIWKLFTRSFNTTPIYEKLKKLNKIKGKSSHEWLERQLTDPYIEKARLMNYRCRSAFKLIEIDDRFKILNVGQNVIDCGAAPGSWTQVVVKRINSDGMLDDQPKGMAIAIDKQTINPIEGATIFSQMDFTNDKTQKTLKDHLQTEKIDVVLSDMAPNATGISHLDQENIIHLCYITLRFACQISKIGATILVKLWQSGQSQQLHDDIQKFYRNVDFIKPKSSRTNSAEIFILGRDFKGLKKTDKNWKSQ